MTRIAIKTRGVDQSLRWAILALVASAFAINLLDRQVLSVAAPVLHRAFHFSNTDFSLMVAAFMFGMAIFQLPVGWLMDRKGPRFGFTVIFVGWSIVNALYAVARSLVQFIGLSFLLGAGECGAYTGGLKVISRWFPVEERALAAGIFNGSFFLGATIAPPLVAWLALHHSWQTAFLLPSVGGLLWLIPWLQIFPVQEDYVVSNGGDLARGTSPISRGDLAALLRARQTWGLIAIRALDGPLGRFYWFWLPLYFSRIYHVGLAAIGWLVPIPFFFAAAGNVLGGYFSKLLLRRGFSLTFSRHSTFILGSALATVSNLLLMGSIRLSLAVVFLCLAIFCTNVLEPCFASYIVDIFPERTVGRLTALTGIADTSMSFILLLATGFVVDHFSYVPIFLAAAILPLLMIASLVWLVGPVKRLALRP
jgi:MFS transporter, ACS family, hexuronate transporter